MQNLNLEQIADYLKDTSITQTIDAGHALIHIGTNVAGTRFVLVNDANGQSVVTEGM